MFKTNKVIEENDRVVFYFSKGNMSVVEIKKNQTFHSKYGSYKHNNIIGIEYGSKVQSTEAGNKNPFFGHVLKLTPELWSLTLDLRTQILFNLDISTIIFNLEVKNGSKVVESGTGSGSLSTSFIRSLQPKGHLYTFEFHEERSKRAIKDFTDNQMIDNVTVTYRDVCKDGFKLEGVSNMVGYIDAVFLDLPSPVDAIDHAVAVLRDGGMICSFSPCIEQVQNTCLMLDKSDFEEITTIEVLMRNFDIKVTEDIELNLINPYGIGEIQQEPQQQDQSTTTTSNTLQSNSNSKMPTKKKWQAGGVVSYTLGEISGENRYKLLAKPFNEERGHTGYLTFARYLPSSKLVSK